MVFADPGDSAYQLARHAVELRRTYSSIHVTFNTVVSQVFSNDTIDQLAKRIIDRSLAQ